MNGYNGTSTISVKGGRLSPWFWIALIVSVLAIADCSKQGYVEKTRQAELDRAWATSPEQSFRFCISTAAGLNGTATPEQITACNKAAGR